MATIKKHGSKYQVSIRKAGYRNLYKSFNTKKDAQAWAALREAEIVKGELHDYTEASKLSFNECIDRFEKEELPKRKHPKKFKSQLGILRSSELATLSLKNVTAKEITKFKNKRLESVGEATVIKDLNQISAIFNKVIKEWFIQVPQGNPTLKVKKPALKPDSSRTRRLTIEEIVDIGVYLHKRSKQMFLLYRLALATGMRRGELVNIKAQDFNPEKAILKIPNTKNGYPRAIPLTKDAYSALYGALQLKQEGKQFDNYYLFSMKADSVTQAFNRACKALGIEDLRWHDIRHEAVSKLFEQGLDMMEVALISGHRSLDMLKRYTHLKPEKIGEKLRNRV